MAKRKLTKEDLEKDPLIDSYQKFQNFYEENRNTVIYSAITTILVIGLSIGYYYYSVSQERKAQQLMAFAEEYYMNGEYEKALTGSEQEFTIGFEQIIANYSNTDAANLARYYAAVSEFNRGNIEKAQSYMQQYEAPEGIMGVGPISFHGVVLTELGQHQEAAKMFVNAAEWDINDSTTPYNYLEAARAYQDAGDIEQAQKYVDKIISDYPNSPQAADAKQLDGLLVSK